MSDKIYHLDDQRPHRVETLSCSECGNTQVSVFPTSIEPPLECCHCHSMTADYLINTAQIINICNIGEEE